MSPPTIDWSELSLQVMITFGHFLWQACAVALLLMIVEKIRELGGSRESARRETTPGRTAYGSACVAFFSLPVCVVATFACVHQARGPVLMIVTAPIESTATHATIEDEPTRRLANADVPMLAPLEMPPAFESPVIDPVERPTFVMPAPSSWSEHKETMASYLLIAYAIGVGLMLSRFGLSIIGSSRLRRTLEPISDANVLRIIAAQSDRLGLKRVPIVASCQRVAVPVVVGIVKPAILLPPALVCGLDPNQLAAILSHEMAHIRRYDLLVNLLQRMVESLLFFHPFTWWISRRVSTERENCCDDVAVAGCGRIEYVDALLKMAEQCAAIRGWKIAPQLESLAADGGNSSQLGYRIKRLLGEDNKPRVSLTRTSIAVIALVAAFGGLSLIAVAQPDADNPAVAPTANVAEFGKESHGLRCRIVPVSPAMDPENVDLSLSQARFESPDDMTFVVEMQNVSDKTIKLRDIRYGDGFAENIKRTSYANHYAPHLFEVMFTDLAGKTVARTQREFVLDSHAFIVHGALVTQIEPRQSIKCLLKPAKFERSMAYRLAPGKYLVQVRYRGPSQSVRDWIEANVKPQEPEKTWPHQVTSNIASFSISANGFRQPDLVWGPETNGLQAALEIRVPRDNGIPTRAPGVLPTTSLHAVLHVTNVSDKPLTFVSESGRQGDTLRIKTAKGEDIKVKNAWFSGEPIDVRWTLQPGDVAELDVLTPSLNQGLAPGEYSVSYTIRFNSRQQKDNEGKQIFPAPGDYDTEIDTGWTPLFLRVDDAASENADAATNETTVEGCVIDSDDTPIAGALVACLPYVGGKDFEAVYTETDRGGRFVAKVPARVFRMGVSSSTEDYDSIREFSVRDGHAVCPWDSVEDQSTEEKIYVVATLPHRYALTFDLVDAVTGTPISDAAILYKEDESTWFSDGESDYESGASWTQYQVIADGEIVYKARASELMNLAHVLVFAKGYEQFQLKLNDSLQRGKPVQKLVRMKAIDPSEFIVTKSDGTPAANATIETLKSAELRRTLNRNGGSHLRQLLNIDVKSDANGIVRIVWPAFSDWTTYRIKHTSGYVNVKGRELPKAVGGNSGIRGRIKLTPYAGIKGTYLPTVGADEFLEVYRLESDRKTVATRAQIVVVDQDGTFKLTQRLAGWHSFVHRIRHTDSDGTQGTTAIGLYGPFELSNGQTRELTLGDEGRSVIGRLTIAAGVDVDYASLRLSVSPSRSSGISFSYPVAPQGLDAKASKDWWDAYWQSDKGRQFRRYRQLHYTTAVASDGRFHFPILPLGKYKLRLSRRPRGSSKLTLEKTELMVPEGANTGPIDLGDLTVSEWNSASAQPAHHHRSIEPSDWIAARPEKVTVASAGTARTLDDHSVRLEGDVNWQDATLQFAFDKPTNVQEIRLELLPIDSPTGPQFGRGGSKLILFDVKPGIEDQSGKYTSLEFDSCKYLQNPNDDSTDDCIDYLSDSGWTVPQLANGAAVHELVLRFQEPISPQPNQRLMLTIDSGGSAELAVLNRIRFSFRTTASNVRAEDEAIQGKTPAIPGEEPAADKATTTDSDSNSKNLIDSLNAVQSLRILANDGDTSKPIKDFRVVVRVPVDGSMIKDRCDLSAIY